LMRLAGLNSFVIDGENVTLSKDFSQAYGVPVGQPIPRDIFRAYLHPDDQVRTREAVERLLSEGGSATMELRAQSPAGWRWVRTTVLADIRPDGRRLIHGLMQDVTELAEAREAALSAERQVRGLMEE